jgi:SAM-dependent methyltransferase
LHLAAGSRGKALDVGCGDGARVRILADLGWQAVGLDPDPIAVERGRASGLNLRVGTLDSHPFAEAEFDAVAASHVIEHVPEPRAFLAHCLALLRPGGRLFLATPNASSLGHATFAAHWRGLEPPRHLQVFTRDALVRCVSEAGFAEVNGWTTARMARTIHVQSAAARGRANGAGPGGQLAALRFEWRERRALRSDPDVGEEILVQAVR